MNRPRVGEALFSPTENPESPFQTLSTRKRSYRIDLLVVAAGDHEALAGGEHVVPVKKSRREMRRLLGLAEAAERDFTCDGRHFIGAAIAVHRIGIV